MITHYGLFWSERDVYWGGNRATPGAMLGKEREPLGRRGAPTADERRSFKDFRNFVGIYCLYGENDLLYIGETGIGNKTTSNLFQRLKMHRKGSLSGRWDRFSWFGRENAAGDVSVEAALSQLEAISIAIVNPGFNKQSGTFKKASQVYQVPHPSAEGDLETKLDRLLGQLSASQLLGAT